MTKGKLVNKKTGDTLTVELLDIEKDGDLELFYYTRIDGDQGARYFGSENWTFEEHKPSTYERVFAMKPGTIFTVTWNDDSPDYRYIKLFDEQVWSDFIQEAFVNDESEWGTEVYEVKEVEA